MGTHIDSGASAAADLGAYLPVVQTSWLADDPDTTWREVDGTLVFADISGFTPLTERLARLGKVGAEELTATLNRVFDVLLGSAEEQGGDLLKFGGDALLLLFTGEQHAARACAAAVGMRRELRAFRRLRTDAGTVALRMSVGVASGTVHLFLVGGSHRELLAAGPVISAVAAMEAAASADEVLVDEAAAALVGAEHLGSEKAGGRLLRRVPRVTSVPLSRAGGAAAAAGVPTALRRHLGTSLPDGEHRVAVLTFLQFKGTDDLLAAEGPASVAAALDELVRAVQEACQRHGATFLASDLDRNGGKILLVAGAPTASTDDGDRMLHTLLEVVPTPRRLTVRAGVNHGRAFAVDVGSRHRRTYAVMGDATNLAARVMGKAEPGQVLATAELLRHLHTDFVVTHLEPFPVKGKSLPVSAAVVGPARGRRAVAGSLPLLGRDDELEVLRSALTSALQGVGRVVSLVGEPGIGKSRLLAEVVERVGSAARTVLVEGAPYALHSPFFALRAPLRQLVGAPAQGEDEDVAAALRAAVGARAPDLEPWLPLLAVPLGLELPETPRTAELDPAFRAVRLRRAVTELLGRLLDGPSVLVVDDAHWLDAASSELLGEVLLGVPTRPWAVFLTRRDVQGGLVPPDESAARTLALGPLPEASSAALLRRATADTPITASAVRALTERSGGNPLFLQELLAAARASGTTEGLPDSIEATVAARIDELPAPDRQLLRHASVLGARFSLPLLASLLEAPVRSVERALARLDGFLVRHGPESVGFRHSLLREVAYEALPFRRRRALHARAGELIEQRAGSDLEEWADLLSLHYAAALRHEPAWRFSRMAGDHARRLAGPADAAVFYRRAVGAAAGLPDCDPREVARTWEALGDVCEVTAEYDAAARAYAKARALARGDALHVVELCRKEGWLRERSARYSEALRWYTRGTRGLAALPDDEDVRRARARLRLAYGIGRLRQGRYRESLPDLEAAAREAEALGDLATLGHAYDVLHWAHTDLGNDDRHRYRELALPIFQQLGNLHREGNVYNNLGIEAYYDGRWDEALELYERSRALWERSGDVAQVGTAANNIGEILSDQGRLDEARRQFDDALFTWRGVRFPVGIALATSNLGRLAVRDGDVEAGRRRFEEARERFRSIGAESFILEVDARRAEGEVMAGGGPAALPLIEATEARVRELGGMPVLLALLDRLAGCALAQGGAVAPAVQRLWRSLEQSGADYEIALTLQVLAALGAGRRGGEPEEAAAEAATLLARLGVVHAAAPPLGRPAPSAVLTPA